MIWTTVSSRKGNGSRSSGQLLYTCCLQIKQPDASPCKEETASAVPPSIPYLGPGRVPPPSHVTVSGALLPGARLGLAAAEAVVHLLRLPLQPAVLGAVDLQRAVPQPALRRALALPRDVPPVAEESKHQPCCGKNPTAPRRGPCLGEDQERQKEPRGSGTLQVTCSGGFDMNKEYTLLNWKFWLFTMLPNAFRLPKPRGN